MPDASTLCRLRCWSRASAQGEPLGVLLLGSGGREREGVEAFGMIIGGIVADAVPSPPAGGVGDMDAARQDTELPWILAMR